MSEVPMYTQTPNPRGGGSTSPTPRGGGDFPNSGGGVLSHIWGGGVLSQTHGGGVLPRGSPGGGYFAVARLATSFAARRANAVD